MAGMGALEDYRGQLDGDGRVLEVTEVAVPDEVAAAADLVKRKLARVPAALLRGVPRPAGDGRARDLVRASAEDLFRTGSGPGDLIEFLRGPRAARRFLPDPVDPQVVERAVVAAVEALPADLARAFRVVVVSAGEPRKRYLGELEAAWREDLTRDGVPADAIERGVARNWGLLGAAPLLLVPCLLPPGDPPGAARATMLELAAGGALRTLLLALHAHGIGGAWVPSSLFRRQAAAGALDLPAGWRPLGSVAAGHPDPTDLPAASPAPDPTELILHR
jgi:coenzyme F420-0:L-glutamate ligase/coenzyme F420-1:gamma-L-glutamate ligase